MAESLPEGPAKSEALDSIDTEEVVITTKKSWTDAKRSIVKATLGKKSAAVKKEQARLFRCCCCVALMLPSTSYFTILDHFCV